MWLPDLIELFKYNCNVSSLYPNNFKTLKAKIKEATAPGAPWQNYTNRSEFEFTLEGKFPDLNYFWTKKSREAFSKWI